ncbi:hypothetical protein PoB_005725100 [Plakobranchus ocellatus]|uniref:MADF domain-containing protein n=1 Tax=Plakobranchus ocellatus TaxID=259542 RepID=A0AAV4C5Z3_9GAST|nr:hypothetical protein PoB_005725100 [Plakobranchus ocellatus]
MALFPPNKEEALINAVESRPTLYDKSDKMYSNRGVVGKLWKDVAEEIESEVHNPKPNANPILNANLYHLTNSTPNPCPNLNPYPDPNPNPNQSPNPNPNITLTLTIT